MSLSKTGFIHDVEDNRDFTICRQDSKVPRGLTPGSELPQSVDLESRFTPVENQGSLGSCTAQAVVGVAEYMTNLSKKTYTDLSRLFLYKVTRNLMGKTGDTGASIRACMHALRTLGTCPEGFYPYNIEDFDEEPPILAYALAQNYKAVTYYRLGDTGDDLVQAVKELISQGTPVVCGVKVFTGYFKDSGNVYYPDDLSSTSSGWHAIILMGYDEAKKMFKFRNSWGTDWGKNGYGWLSYDYIKNTATSADFWALNNINFIDINDIL